MADSSNPLPFNESEDGWQPAQRVDATSGLRGRQSRRWPTATHRGGIRPDQRVLGSAPAGHLPGGQPCARPPSVACGADPGDQRNVGTAGNRGPGGAAHIVEIAICDLCPWHSYSRRADPGGRRAVSRVGVSPTEGPQGAFVASPAGAPNEPPCRSRRAPMLSAVKAFRVIGGLAWQVSEPRCGRRSDHEPLTSRMPDPACVRHNIREFE